MPTTTTVPTDRRRAVLLVLAISRGCTPEQADQLPVRVLAALDDPLEVAEAEDWLRLLERELAS